MGEFVEVSWDGEQVGQALLDKARPFISQGLARGLPIAGELWQGAMTRRMRGRTFGPQLPGTINRRSGNLVRSLSYRVLTGPKPEDNRLVMFAAGARYARAQQFGATIRPRAAKRLAIPGPANLTGAGVTRKPNARSWFEEFKKSGQIALVRSRRTPGNTVVLWRRTKRSRWEHWWTLSKGVTLPGPNTDGSPSRLQFFETYDAQAKERAEILRDNVQRALNQANLSGVLEAGKVRIV